MLKDWMLKGWNDKWKDEWSKGKDRKTIDYAPYNLHRPVLPALVTRQNITDVREASEHRVWDSRKESVIAWNLGIADGLEAQRWDPADTKARLAVGTRFFEFQAIDEREKLTGFGRMELKEVMDDMTKHCIGLEENVIGLFIFKVFFFFLFSCK